METDKERALIKHCCCCYFFSCRCCQSSHLSITDSIENSQTLDATLKYCDRYSNPAKAYRYAFQKFFTTSSCIHKIVELALVEIARVCWSCYNTLQSGTRCLNYSRTRPWYPPLKVKILTDSAQSTAFLAIGPHV